MFTLERGSRKFTCPSCAKSGVFVRYVDDRGQYLADNVGRCDRESKCGYHYPPRQYFEENPSQSSGRLYRSDRGTLPTTGQSPHYDVIDFDYLKGTLNNYDQNAFVQFLMQLFPHDKRVGQVLSEYVVGTYPNAYGAYTCFPYINGKWEVLRGKLIRYHPKSGKRLKGKFDTSSLVKKLRMKEGFVYGTAFFGEHLLEVYPDRPIGVVESEKSAIICSICEGAFPDMVWLATGSKQWLNAERLSRIATGRIIVLLPDADGFARWEQVAQEARKAGLKTSVSDLIEKRATAAEKAAGSDVADYLIREQIKRNDPSVREAFRDLIEERLAIMTEDGGISEDEAERRIVDDGYYDAALRYALSCGRLQSA